MVKATVTIEAEDDTHIIPSLEHLIYLLQRGYITDNHQQDNRDSRLSYELQRLDKEYE